MEIFCDKDVFLDQWENTHNVIDDATQWEKY